MTNNATQLPSRKIRSRRSTDPSLKLHILIVRVFGVLSFVSILTGAIAVFAAARADTVLEVAGIRFSTASVGIAFMAISLIVAYLAVRSVLKSQKEIARLQAQAGDQG